MNGRLKSVLSWLLMLALAGLLLYFAFRGVKWSDLESGIRSCDFGWIGLSMVVSTLAIILRGLRWRILMLPLNRQISRREAFDGISVGYLTNFALPRAGEFARCGVISATGKAPYESVLGTVILERTWDLVCYVLILVGVLLLRWNEFGAFVDTQVWQPLAGRLPFNAAWLTAALFLAAAAATWAVYRYRKALRRFRLLDKLLNIGRGLLNGLTAGFRMPHKGIFFTYTLLIWTCFWLMSVFTIRAFPSVGGLDLTDALFLMVVGGMGWIVPVQGGIGAYHFIISLALSSLYAIPQTSGVVFATISHESQAIVMVLCGLFSLVSIALRKKATT